MSPSRRIKRWLIAAAAATTMGTGYFGSVHVHVHAGSPEPVQRVGRFVGAGWGDGYHACETSGFRPTANLPPRSFYQQYGPSLGSKIVGMAGAKGCGDAVVEFYARGGGCESSHCDAAGCDGQACDGQACDGQACHLPVGEAGMDHSFGHVHSPHPSAPSASAPSQWYSQDTMTLSDTAPKPVAIPTPVAEQSTTLSESDLGENIQELPAPLIQGDNAGDDAENNSGTGPILSPASPSDSTENAPAPDDSSWSAPSGSFQIAERHESEKRPIRPLPPQRNRELVRPAAPSELDMPSMWRSQRHDASTKDQPRGSLPHSRQVIRVDGPNVKTNPFVIQEAVDPVVVNRVIADGQRLEPGRPRRPATEQRPTVERNVAVTSDRPVRLGAKTSAAARPDMDLATPEHRVAEVPEWLIVKQPH